MRATSKAAIIPIVLLVTAYRPTSAQESLTTLGVDQSVHIECARDPAPSVLTYLQRNHFKTLETAKLGPGESHWAPSNAIVVALNQKGTIVELITEEVSHRYDLTMITKVPTHHDRRLESSLRELAAGGMRCKILATHFGTNSVSDAETYTAKVEELTRLLQEQR
jgi:hypothetical protein